MAFEQYAIGMRMLSPIIATGLGEVHVPFIEPTVEAEYV